MTPDASPTSLLDPSVRAMAVVTYHWMELALMGVAVELLAAAAAAAAAAVVAAVAAVVAAAAVVCAEF